MDRWLKCKHGELSSAFQHPCKTQKKLHVSSCAYDLSAGWGQRQVDPGGSAASQELPVSMKNSISKKKDGEMIEGNIPMPTSGLQVCPRG